jgi:[ribosomal protein S5]-alanine N-acetyltransferase
MNGLARLETARLLLTRIGPGDFDDLHSLHANPQVMATLGGVRSPHETGRVLDALAAHWDEHGFGYWMARDLVSGQFVGRGGLRQVLLEGRTEVEVGYACMPPFWGRGLATELARESARVAFDRLAVAELVCFALPTNRASQRVMEKVGFRRVGDTVWADRPHVLYRLSRSQWRAQADPISGGLPTSAPAEPRRSGR